MNKKSRITHARTCVYNVNYHIVWSVKYRRKVLDHEIKQYLKTLFQEIAEVLKEKYRIQNKFFYSKTYQNHESQNSRSEACNRKRIQNYPRTRI